MVENQDFIIVHTITEKRTIQGAVVDIKKTEKWSLKKYVGKDEVVTIPEGIETISPNAFKNCETMHSVEIPASVKTIGCGAFSGCINLKSVVIPDSVKKIGSSAFSNCGNLEAAVFDGDIPWFNCEPQVFFDCPTLTIYAKKDTYIKHYAKSNKIPFSPI